jgi:hypothetical protein
MCNVYRKFVPRFSKIAAPLTELLRKGQPDAFDSLAEEQIKAFDTRVSKALIGDLREDLSDPPVLSLPKPTNEFTLDIAAATTN